MLAVAAALVAAPVALVATSAGASRGGAYHITLPDLQILVPTNLISIGVSPDTGDQQLQFTHITWDAGAGPFQIKPKYNHRTGTAKFVQTIYKSRTPGSWRPAFTVPLAATGIFDPPSDYRYPLTRFTLNAMNGDGSVGAVLAVSPKSDYCITADAFVGGVPDAPNNTSPPQSNCTKPNRPLGFSVGWGDQYDQTDHGQPIDLIGIPDGTYVLRAEVDPQHLFSESDPNNNVVDTVLQIVGGSVTVVSQTSPGSPLPAVALSSIRAGSKVSGKVALQAPAKAVAPATISSVQFLLDGQPLGAPVTSTPYAYTWTVGSTSPGSHDLSARATDSAGHMATAPVKTVSVVNSSPNGLAGAHAPVPTAAIVNPVAHQTVSGTIPVAAIASDAVGVKSVEFLLDGRPLSTPVHTAPYAVQWNTKSVADGPHTLSAIATNTSGVAGTVTDVPVTVANPAPPMTCFVLQKQVGARGRGTVTAPSFHTAAGNETLVAFVAADGPPAGKQTATVSGAGLKWKLVKRADAGSGDAEIWAATAPSVLTGATVTSELTNSAYDQDLTVIAMEGISGVGASSAASGAGGSPSVTLTTSKPTSLVFAVGDGKGAVARTLPFGWVSLGQWIDRSSQSTFWDQYTNQPTGGSGTVVTVNATAPSTGGWNMAAVELPGDGS
ncbi:MAG TPA: Ig-like domain-containing protein [Acidimicrobiales bacterium]